MLKRLIFSIFVLFTTALSAEFTIVDIIVPQGVETDYLYGLDYHDGYLWVGDDGQGLIHQVDPADGSVISSFQGAPDSNHGLTWDGEYFWVAGDYHADGNIYKMTSDGTIISTIPNPGDDYSGGLCWHEDHLWISVYYPNTQPNVHKLNPADGTILQSLTTVGLQPQGLVFQDENTLWNSMDDNDNDEERCTAYDPATGDTLQSFPVPTTKPRGMAWDGQHLYLVAKAEGSWQQVIYKIDTEGSGTPEIIPGFLQHDFGTVIIGSTGNVDLPVTNNGTAQLEITSLLFTLDEFSCSLELPIQINPGETEYLPLVFQPLTWGSFESGLTLESNDPLNPQIEIELSGYGIYNDQTIIVEPVLLDYGSVRTGSTNGNFLQISNQGNEALTVSEIISSNPIFYLDSSIELPFVLNSQDANELRIWFHPETAGSHDAILEIMSDDPMQNIFTLPLSGNAETLEYPIGSVLWEYMINTSWDNSPKAISYINDINGDDINDVIVCSEDNYIRCFNGNSSGIADILWEQEIYSGNVYSQKGISIISDIDEDGYEDIIIGTTGGDRSIRALSSATGSNLWQYDTNQYGNGGWVYQVYSRRDYNGDGIPDVLAATGDDSSDTGPKRVFCLDGVTGSLIWAYYAGGPVFSVIGVADMNDDGIPEVLAGASNENETEGKVILINGATGSVVWTYITPGSSVWALEELRDINGDERDDVIAGDFYGNYYGLDITNGSVVWSGLVGNFVLLTRFQKICDLNNDGHCDIIVENSSDYAVVINGYTGDHLWDQYIGDNSLSVGKIPDVNADQIPDVLIGSLNNSCYFLDGSTGTTINSNNLGTAVDAISSIPDIVGDDSWEMIAGGRNGLVRCLSGGIDVITNSLPDVIDVLSSRLTGNYPNPFNPETKIEYYLDRNQKIEISIYNLKGQKIRQLENSVHETGYHSVIWDGSDNNGIKMPSGIYFTRISGLDFSDVQKMVMIK